jgi:hypothetical protein
VKSKDAVHEAKLNEITEKLTEELANATKIADSLKTDYEELSSTNRDQICKVRKEHAEQSHEIRESFIKKLESEKNRYEKQLEMHNTLERQWMGKMTKMNMDHKTKAAEIESFFKTKIESVELKIAKIKKESQIQSLLFDERIKDIEEDAENESLGMIYKFERKLKEEKALFSTVSENNTRMKETYAALLQQIEDHKKELVNSGIESKMLHQEIKSLENDITSLNNELKERDDTISEKEKRIYDLKKMNQELEKFKFVLDYKIIELRKQIEPREKDIEQLLKQIDEMRQELIIYGRNHLELDASYQDLIMKNHATLMCRYSEAWRYQQIVNSIAKVKAEINFVFSSLSSKSEFKKLCMELYHNFKNLKEEPPEWAPRDHIPQFTEKGMLQEIELLYRKEKKIEHKEPEIIRSGGDTNYRQQLEATIHFLKKDDKKAQERRIADVRKTIDESVILTQYCNS